jgi:MoaA/NifB/PqqE/SkfB family radical SAM enzyme
MIELSQLDREDRDRYYAAILSRDQIQLDIHSKCTLNCNGCARKQYNDYKIKVPGERMSIECFKKIIEFFVSVNFCGQISDPILHPKFPEFLKLIYEKEVYLRTQVATAVSHKPLSWHKKCYEANPKAKWIFGIDGLPEESHKYRVNQDGIKEFERMKLCAEMGLDTMWQYIIFDYNENHVDEARQMATDIGVWFVELRSTRWNEETIHLKPKQEDSFGERNPIEKLRPKCIESLIKNKPGSLSRHGAKQLGHSATGYLLPCCWLDPSSSREQEFDDTKDLFQDHLKIENVDTIEEILFSDEWINFFKVLVTDPENAPSSCQRRCRELVVDEHDRIVTNVIEKPGWTPGPPIGRIVK